jgi:hypothetical protein
LRLNLVQALMGQSKAEPDNLQLVTNMQQTMEYIRKIIPDKHLQFKRFHQLEELLRGFMSAKLGKS